MALTIETIPADNGRVYDTNRLMYRFSSNNYGQPNFRFIIYVKYAGPVEYATFDPDDVTLVATIRKRPLTDGSVYFNPAE